MLDKHPAEYYLEIVEALNELMYLGTGYKLNQYQTTYEPKHIENTERNRKDILKVVTKNELLKQENDMYVLRDLCSSLLDIADDELERRKKRGENIQ